MSAYNWAVQVGMPEGLDSEEQQLWLHKWLLGKDAKIDRLQECLAESIQASRLAMDQMYAMAEQVKKYQPAYDSLCLCVKTVARMNAELFKAERQNEE